MKKSVRAWACLNKRGTCIKILGVTRIWSERLVARRFGEGGWADLKEAGYHLVPGTFTYDDGKPGKGD